jgi:ribonuclease BN (tRNA processing enzyme)
MKQTGNTKLVLLGTGTPNAEPTRSGPSVAVVANGRPYLVDFGPGVVRRAVAAHQNGVKGLGTENLCRAFLTHLHSDHTAGYPDLILTPWVLERNQPLQVFGPAGIQAMTDHMLAAYQEDIRERIEGLEPANLVGHRVIVKEIEAGIVYEDADIVVEAFPANHGAWPAFSYRFTTEDRTIVISGDTAPHGAMVEEYTDCDILVHEVYSSVGFQMLPKEWQRYHAQVHTSTRELARVASEARPGLLVLYHQLLWEESEQGLVQEIEEIYSGPVVFGKDLAIF